MDGEEMSQILCTKLDPVENKWYPTDIELKISDDFKRLYLVDTTRNREGTVLHSGSVQIGMEEAIKFAESCHGEDFVKKLQDRLTAYGFVATQ